MPDIKDSGCMFSKDDIIQFIANALKDPHNPTYCGKILAWAVKLVIPTSTTTTTSTVDKDEVGRMNKLTKTLFYFVTAKRTPGELKAFLERFATCDDCAKVTVAGGTRRWTMESDLPVNINGSINDHDYAHESGTGGMSNRISRYLHLQYADGALEVKKKEKEYMWFCTFVAAKKADEVYPAFPCIFAIDAIKWVDRALGEVDFGAAARGVSKLWPSRVTSLIRAGPDQLVSSLLQWYKVYPDPITIKLIATITSLCRSLIHPTLIKHKFALVATDSTKRVLDRCLSVFASKDILPDTLQLCDTYKQQSCAFFDVVQALTQDQLPGEVVLQLMNGCETKVIQLCCIIVYLGPRSLRYLSMSMMANNGGAFPSMPTMATFAQQKFHLTTVKPSELTSILCHMLRTQHPSTPRPTVHIALPMVYRDREVFFGSEQGLEADIALASFWKNGINYGCYNRLFRGCRNSFEALGKDIKTCDQCLAVFYCSKKCQAEDWKAGEYSHKQLCPILRKIVHNSASAVVKSGTSKLKVLQAAIRGAESDVARIKAVRVAIRRARLSQAEMNVLHSVGKRMYRALVLERLTWSAGYNDYDAHINLLTNHHTFAVAGTPEAAAMTKVPSEEIKKQKSLLLAVRFWG